MAIERLEEMVAPLEGASQDDSADIKEKLEEARALLVDARALHQHLSLIKEQKNMGSLDRLVHYWNMLRTSALSKANYMTSALSSSREVDVLKDGADESSTGSS